MWPYDYSREDETPLLWVSEGFTNYYGALLLYRAGLRDRQKFMETVSGAAEDVDLRALGNHESPSVVAQGTVPDLRPGGERPRRADL